MKKSILPANISDYPNVMNVVIGTVEFTPFSPYHHTIPRSAITDKTHQRVSIVNCYKHAAFHALFGNLHPCQIIKKLNKWYGLKKSKKKFVVYRRFENVAVERDRYMYKQSNDKQEGLLLGSNREEIIKAALSLLFCGMTYATQARELTKTWINYNYIIRFE